MSPKNRGDRIQLLVKAVQKHFTPVLAPNDRNLLEHLLYACCLEDASYEAADEAFHRLQESFFDWNEVRVTTLTELIEHLHNLPDPKAAAVRIKKNLQTVFETRYSFDLQDMIKMNQGKAVAELEKFHGMSRFVLAYVTQNALGGHSIPVSQNIIQLLLRAEIVSESEAQKQNIPGLERSVAKSKGTAISSCLHQMGLLLAHSPQGKQTLSILKEAGANISEKRTTSPDKKTGKPAEEKEASKKIAPGKPASKAESAAKEASPATASDSSPPSAPGKKMAARKSDGDKSSSKEATGKKPPAKSPAKAAPAKPTQSKLPPPKPLQAKSASAKPPQAKSPKSKNSPEKSATTKRKPK